MPDHPHAGGETYRLTLRALPSGYPPTGRLKRALKQLLRVFELRCERLEELKPDEAQTPVLSAPPTPPASSGNQSGE